jgi:hypothetical protein
MSKQANINASNNILLATFKSILQVLDACELEDCINYAQSKALEGEFKKDVPLIFTDSSRRLRK